LGKVFKFETQGTVLCILILYRNFIKENTAPNSRALSERMEYPAALSLALRPPKAQVEETTETGRKV
jgi:hypothetical protein